MMSRRLIISQALKIRRHSPQIRPSQRLLLLKASAITRPRKTWPMDTRQEMNCRVARRCSGRGSYFGESSRQLNPTAAEANSLSPRKSADAPPRNPAKDIQFGRVCPELSRNRRLIESHWRFLSVPGSTCHRNPAHSTPSARHKTVPQFPAEDTGGGSYRLQPAARVDTSRKWPHWRPAQHQEPLGRHPFDRRKQSASAPNRRLEEAHVPEPHSRRFRLNSHKPSPHAHSNHIAPRKLPQNRAGDCFSKHLQKFHSGAPFPVRPVPLRPAARCGFGGISDF